MKHLNISPLKLTLLFLIFIGFSCEENNIEDEDLNLLTETFESPCTDVEIASYLPECIWSGVSSEDDSLFNLTFNFTDGIVTVYNDDNLVVDEGNWTIVDGIVTFDSLTGAFENFTGDWNVIECRESFVRIERGEAQIGFERDCTTDDNSDDSGDDTTGNASPCTDAEITSYLFECIWFGASSEDDSLFNLTFKFTDGIVTVYNEDNVAVDEGNWTIVDGVVTFDSLTGAFENFTGDWNVIECREGFVRIERGEAQIGFERDCI